MPQPAKDSRLITTIAVTVETKLTRSGNPKTRCRIGDQRAYHAMIHTRRWRPRRTVTPVMKPRLKARSDSGAGRTIPTWVPIVTTTGIATKAGSSERSVLLRVVAPIRLLPHDMPASRC